MVSAKALSAHPHSRRSIFNQDRPVHPRALSVLAGRLCPESCSSFSADTGLVSRGCDVACTTSHHLDPT